MKSGMTSGSKTSQIQYIMFENAVFYSSMFLWHEYFIQIYWKIQIYVTVCVWRHWRHSDKHDLSVAQNQITFFVLLVKCHIIRLAKMFFPGSNNLCFSKWWLCTGWLAKCAPCWNFWAALVNSFANREVLFGSSCWTVNFCSTKTRTELLFLLFWCWILPHRLTCPQVVNMSILNGSFTGHIECNL